MALVVPDVGEVELLDKMLKDALSVDESYTLKLYSAISPALGEASVAGDSPRPRSRGTSRRPSRARAGLARRPPAGRRRRRTRSRAGPPPRRRRSSATT